MTLLRLVGGTDVGDAPAPPAWDDAQEGAGRILREAHNAGLERVALVGRTPDGDLYVAGTGRSCEETIGYFQRAIGYLCRMEDEEAESHGPGPGESA